MKKFSIALVAMMFIVANAQAQERAKDELMFGFGSGITQSSKFGFGYGVTFDIQKLDMYPKYDFLIQFRYTRFSPNLLYGQMESKSYLPPYDNFDVTIIDLEGSVINEVNEFGLVVGFPASKSHGRKQIYWLFDFNVGSIQGTHMDFEGGIGIIEPETGIMFGLGTGPMFRVQLIKDQFILSGKLISGIGALKLREYDRGFWEAYPFAKVTI